MDTVSVGAGYGLGLSAQVQASEVFHGAVGASSNSFYGTLGRYAGRWHEVDMGWPVTFLLAVMLGPYPDDLTPGYAAISLSLLALPHDAEIVVTGSDCSWTPEGGTHSCVINPLFTRYVYVPLICRWEGWEGEIKPYRPSGELSLSFMALVVGGRVSFNPIQLGDFLVGFVGLDPAGDDPWQRSSCPVRPEKSAEVEQATGATPPD